VTRRLGVPLLTWVATVAAITALAAAFGYHPFDSATWSRYDSAHYEDIARNGYDLFRCPPGVWIPGAWCGDAGWFPGYSWVFGALHLAGLPLRASGVAVSWFFAAATLVLVWNTFFRHRTDVTALFALLYAAWAPGQIYDYSIFPMSVLAFFTVAHLWLLVRGRYVLAGLAGAAAVLSYPLGVLLVPVSAAWLLLQRGVAVAERVRRTAIASGLTLGGLGVLFVDQAVETGHWNAYFLVQKNYKHHFLNPVATTRDSLRPVVDWSPFELHKFGPALQTALVTAALAAVVIHALVRRGTLDRADALLLLFAVVTWVVPLSQSYVSLQRSQAALLPLAVLVRKLPRRVVIALAVAAVPVAAVMEKLFLQGKIV
jgi:hypothetical protein